MDLWAIDSSHIIQTVSDNRKIRKAAQLTETNTILTPKSDKKKKRKYKVNSTEC